MLFENPIFFLKVAKRLVCSHDMTFFSKKLKSKKEKKWVSFFVVTHNCRIFYMSRFIVSIFGQGIFEFCSTKSLFLSSIFLF